MPKVSVLTSIYNTKPDYLRACIESILNQSFKDFEFLILNDSPDNKEIEKIVLSYKDKRIKYIKNEKNIGISASRNKLLDLATGEYIAIFDHDDISLPYRLEEEVKFLDKNPDVGVVSGWLEFFDNKKANFIWKTPEYDSAIRIFLTQDCCVAHTACMIRKSVLAENNIRYESYYSPAEDYMLWYRLICRTNFHNLQKVLVRYRNHEDMTTLSQSDRMSLASYAIALRIRNLLPAYYEEYKKSYCKSTLFRLYIFGKVPLFKLKRNWIFLFGFIPVFKLAWR